MNHLLFFIFFSLQGSSQATDCRSLNNDPAFESLLSLAKSKIQSCSASKIHLTFDDGPSPNITPKILEALNRRNIKATFFITTTNLRQGSTGQNKKVVLDEMDSGHLVANHGYEHNPYDLRIVNDKRSEGFNVNERESQIVLSEKLLTEATNGKFNNQEFKLFRFPYGRGAAPSENEINEIEASGKMIFNGNSYASKLAEYRRSSPALIQIAGHDYSHLGWNIDSSDSSLGVDMPKENIVQDYIMKNILQICNAKIPIGVSLFHDIKEINTRAIPLIIDIGQCLGASFIGFKELSTISSSLVAKGVLIPAEEIKKGVVLLKNKLDETIKQIGSVKPNNCQINNTETPTSKTDGCFSDYTKRYYSNCQGESSICFENKWYSPSNPLIISNCGNR